MATPDALDAATGQSRRQTARVHFRVWHGPPKRAELIGKPISPRDNIGKARVIFPASARYARHVVRRAVTHSTPPAKASMSSNSLKASSGVKPIDSSTAAA